MVQKPLNKNKKGAGKASAANRHGKVSKTKKGKYCKPPKKGVEKANYEEAKSLTKMINQRNHETVAGVAAQSGGHFKVIQAPPVAATAHEKQTKKEQQKKKNRGDEEEQGLA